jgi:hypothetical protein
VLSQHLGDRGFERYALAQFIQHCGVALFGPWAFIEARCRPGSSIRRFANHWVAWNASFAGSSFGSVSEFAGLKATSLVNRVVRNETHDPRTFDLEHWYSACGDDLAAKCDHDPVVRRAKERERRRPAPPKPSLIGRADELRQQIRTGSKKLSRWRSKRRILFVVRSSPRHIPAGCDPVRPLILSPSCPLDTLRRQSRSYYRRGRPSAG